MLSFESGNSIFKRAALVLIVYILLSALIPIFYTEGFSYKLNEWSDGGAYIAAANYIASHNLLFLPKEYKYWPPLFPICISLFMKLGLTAHTATRIFFIVLSASIGLGFYFLFAPEYFKIFPNLIYAPLYLPFYYPNVLISLNAWSELFFVALILMLIIVLKKFDSSQAGKALFYIALATLLSCLAFLTRYLALFLLLFINLVIFFKKDRLPAKTLYFLVFNPVFILTVIGLKAIGYSSFSKIGLNPHAVYDIAKYLIPVITRDNFLPFCSLPGQSGVIAGFFALRLAYKFIIISLGIIILSYFMKNGISWVLKRTDTDEFIRRLSGIKLLILYNASFMLFFLLFIFIAPVWIETRMLYPFYLFVLIALFYCANALLNTLSISLRRKTLFYRWFIFLFLTVHVSKLLSLYVSLRNL